MTIQEIIKKEKNPDEIGRLIKKLGNSDIKPNFTDIDLIENFLLHSDYFVRESAAYTLFFKWKIANKRLIEKALKMAINENEDFDVRKWIFSSFPDIYEKTNDKRIIQLTYNVFKYSKDDIIRNSCLRTLLRIYGIETKDILFKEIENNINFFKGTIKDRIELFSKELSVIEKIINDY